MRNSNPPQLLFNRNIVDLRQKKEVDSLKEEEAATVIQASFRGHQERNTLRTTENGEGTIDATLINEENTRNQSNGTENYEETQELTTNQNNISDVNQEEYNTENQNFLVETNEEEEFDLNQTPSETVPEPSVEIQENDTIDTAVKEIMEEQIKEEPKATEEVVSAIVDPVKEAPLKQLEEVEPVAEPKKELQDEHSAIDPLVDNFDDNIKPEAEAIIDRTSSRPTDDEVIDIDLQDPEVEKAALKIQSVFKGFSGRKRIKPNNEVTTAAPELKDDNAESNLITEEIEEQSKVDITEETKEEEEQHGEQQKSKETNIIEIGRMEEEKLRIEDEMIIADYKDKTKEIEEFGQNLLENFDKRNLTEDEIETVIDEEYKNDEVSNLVTEEMKDVVDDSKDNDAVKEKSSNLEEKYIVLEEGKDIDIDDGLDNVLKEDKDIALDEGAVIYVKEGKEIDVVEGNDIVLPEAKDIDLSEGKDIVIHNGKDIYEEEKIHIDVENLEIIDVEKVTNIGIEQGTNINVKEETDINVEDETNINADQTKDMVVEEGKNMIVDVEKDIAVEEGNDMVVDEEKDIVVEEGNDMVVDEQKDIIVEEGKDIVMEDKNDMTLEEDRNVNIKDDVIIDKEKYIVIEHPDTPGEVQDIVVGDELEVVKGEDLDILVTKTEPLLEEQSTLIESGMDQSGEIIENKLELDKSVNVGSGEQSAIDGNMFLKESIEGNTIIDTEVEDTNISTVVDQEEGQTSEQQNLMKHVGDTDDLELASGRDDTTRTEDTDGQA